MVSGPLRNTHRRVCIYSCRWCGHRPRLHVPDLRARLLEGAEDPAAVGEDAVQGAEEEAVEEAPRAAEVVEAAGA